MHASGKAVSVVFVCLGNICRSPMAEALFRAAVNKRGLGDQIKVESSGTGTWNIGKIPHEGTRKILDQVGVSYEGQVAKRLEASELLTYDYIIAMDRMNVSDLVKMGVPKDRIHLLTDYVRGKLHIDVPDPYYHDNFDEVYELIQQGVDGILDRIVRSL